MKYPSLNQFTSPADITILKYYTYLHNISKKCTLSPQEEDMLNGNVHHHELCQVLYTSPYLRPWFSDPFTMNLNLKEYVTNLVLTMDGTIPPKELPKAINVLLCDTASKLFAPMNGLYTCVIRTPCGDVIKVYEGIERISIEALDRMYLGFSATFLYELQHGLGDTEAIRTLESMIQYYHIPDRDEWICKETWTNYPMIAALCNAQAQRVLYQLKCRLEM